MEADTRLAYFPNEPRRFVGRVAQMIRARTASAAGTGGAVQQIASIATESSATVQQVSIADAVQQGLVAVTGDLGAAVELFALFDDFSPMFEIVEPKPEP